MTTSASSPPMYRPDRAALLFIDPYNDFLSEGGKLWPQLAPVVETFDVIANLRAVSQAARSAGLRIFIVPHHRAEHDDFAGWDHPTPYQQASSEMQIFACGEWGGEWRPEFAPQPGDVVVKEHMSSSGFANTDLDLQLRQHGITHLILIGLIANTCVETTAKFAVELGYHVTLVRDATAALSFEAMHAAHDINGPTYAHVILTSAELLPVLQPLQRIQP